MTDAVDVVIVTYGNVETIGPLMALVHADPLIGVVVVVDHGDDGSGAVARCAGAEVLEDQSNPGFGTGQNRGFARTSSQYVLLLNPDALLLSGAIEAGMRYLDRSPRTAAVQGQIRNMAIGLPERSAGSQLGPVHLFGRALDLKRLRRYRIVQSIASRTSLLVDHIDRMPAGPREVEALAATAILVRRSAFDEIGGFDERFFLYGEDLDLSRRFGEAGWRLATLPVPWALHESGGSAAGWWDRELRWWEGTLQHAAFAWCTRDFVLAMAAAGIQWSRMAFERPGGCVEAARSLFGAPIRWRRLR